MKTNTLTKSRDHLAGDSDNWRFEGPEQTADLNCNLHVLDPIEQEKKTTWKEYQLKKEMVYQILLSVLTFFILILSAVLIFNHHSYASVTGHGTIISMSSVESTPAPGGLYKESKYLAPVLGLGFSLFLMVMFHWFQWWVAFFKTSAHKKRVDCSP